MRKLLTLLLLFCCYLGVAQTQPSLPAGSTIYSNNLFLDPDGNVWTGKAGSYTNLGSFDNITALIPNTWTPAQIDSAIMSVAVNYIPLSQKAAANGVATLDNNGKVPLTQIPDVLIGSVNYQGNWNASTNTPTLPETPGSSTKGHYYVVSTPGTWEGVTFNSGDWIISNGSAWGKVDNNNSVTSVNGKVGAVNLKLSDLSDVPSSYSGASGKFLAVKTTEDGVEFKDVVIPAAQTLSQPAIGQIAISNGNTIDLNTVNTSGNQTGIGGDKAWTGLHTFGAQGLRITRSDGSSNYATITYNTGGSLLVSNNIQFATSSNNRIINSNSSASYIEIGQSNKIFRNANIVNANSFGLDYERSGYSTNTVHYNHFGLGVKEIITSNNTNPNLNTYGANIEVENNSTVNSDIRGIHVNVGLGTNTDLTGRKAAVFLGGNVGIGTETPTEMLDVVGNIKASSLSGTGNGIVGVTSTGQLTRTNVADFGYVPYTGASSAVNLNAQNLTNVGTFRAAVTQIPTNTVEVAEKNKSYYLISHTDGAPVAKWEAERWTGTAFTASNSYGFGHQALRNNTGNLSNGFGHHALSNNTGNNSNGFGYASLQNNTGTKSNGFGYYTLQNNTGNYDNGFGHQALRHNKGNYNNAFGYNVLYDDPGETVRSNITAIGNNITWSAITKNNQTVFSGHEIIGLDLTNTRINSAAGNALVTKDWVGSQIGNGTLTLATGTGLTGTASFTANQTGNATFTVGVDAGYKLPTTTEAGQWGDAYTYSQVGHVPLSQKGANNGVAPLNASGVIPWEHLPTYNPYKGTWDASTNTPSIADGVGTAGDYYRVSVSGTQNLGSGNITFNVGDDVIYSGSVWQRVPGGSVATNLGLGTRDSTTLAITNSNGTGFTLPAVTNSQAGLMTAHDKKVLSTALQPGSDISELTNDLNYTAAGSNITLFNNNAGYIVGGIGADEVRTNTQLDERYIQTELDPTVPQHVKDIASSDLLNWNSKISSVTGGTGIIVDATDPYNPIINASAQSLIFTGDVTGSGTGTIELTLADDSVKTQHLADASVTNAKLADTAVTTDKIADNAVTFAKMQQMEKGRILGTTGTAANPWTLYPGQSSIFEWGSGINYTTVGLLVRYDGAVYRNILGSGNIGQTPSSSPTYWQYMGTFEGVYNEGTFDRDKEFPVNSYIQYSAPTSAVYYTLTTVEGIAPLEAVPSDPENIRGLIVGEGFEIIGDEIRVSSTAGGITGLIQAGTNVSISGSGTSVSPYVISATGSGGGVTALNQLSDVSIPSPSNNQVLTYSGGLWRAITPTTYTLPAATSSGLGGVKLGSDIVQSVAANAPSSEAGKTYPVQLNSAGQAVVNVPWVSGSGGNNFRLRSGTNAYLSNDVTLLAGTNVTLSQSGQNITINATAGSGGITALTGDVLASGTGSVAATINNGAVSNAKMANMAANTLKGRIGTSGAPTDLDRYQINSLLNTSRQITSPAIIIDTNKGYYDVTSSTTMSLQGTYVGFEYQLEVTNSTGSDYTLSFVTDLPGGGTVYVPEGVDTVVPAGKTVVFSFASFRSGSTRLTKVVY